MNNSTDIRGEVVPIQNRLIICPDCGAKLISDKSPITTQSGSILRARTCPSCYSIFYTKQEPERIEKRAKYHQ